jgi:hypothetical protein
LTRSARNHDPAPSTITAPIRLLGRRHQAVIPAARYTQATSTNPATAQAGPAGPASVTASSRTPISRPAAATQRSAQRSERVLEGVCAGTRLIG